MTKITLKVNARRVEADLEPRTSLADFLRRNERLTGTHLGCEHGVCGACTINVNGAPARSCIALAVALDGAEVRTIEGFDDDPVMAKIRDAFHREHALQCGFCTPGMLITARDIVTRFADADEKRIRAELAGNLCRCTGYMGIVNAIQRVMREMPAEARLAMTNETPAMPALTDVSESFRPFIAEAKPSEPVMSRPSIGPSVELEKGWSRIVDSFAVAKPASEVWKLFADIPRMARAMPGAELSAFDGQNLKGRMRVAFGPIKAGFDGSAAIQRDDATMTAVIRGGGSDERGGSRAKGIVRYRLVDQDSGAAARVELTLDYQLQGPLAQFGRTGLVRDFARRLIAEFVANLANDLSGMKGPSERTKAPFKAGAAFWAVLWARIKRALGL
jgi:aerobic carbon-monoxide dehydrogenase small subunit